MAEYRYRTFFRGPLLPAPMRWAEGTRHMLHGRMAGKAFVMCQGLPTWVAAP